MKYELHSLGRGSREQKGLGEALIGSNLNAVGLVEWAIGARPSARVLENISKQLHRPSTSGDGYAFFSVGGQRYVIKRENMATKVHVDIGVFSEVTAFLGKVSARSKTAAEVRLGTGLANEAVQLLDKLNQSGVTASSDQESQEFRSGDRNS